MAERNEAVEPQAVRDGSAGYAIEPEIATAEDVPPGYKRTQVGVIPQDWDIGCLGDFYEIKSSKRVLQRDWRRYGVPFYRTREVAVLAEAGHVDNELHISEELYSVYAKKYGIPKPGDLLVTGIGTIGKMYVVPDERKFYFKDASIIWLKSLQSFDSSYLKQLFETRIIRDQLADASTGTTVDTYTISGANKTVVPVPQITEQRAIATALSDADALIESLDRLISKKRAIKQAAMQQLLTGETRLPGFTGEWETKRVGNAASFHKGSGLSKADLLVDGDSPCIHYGELFTQYGERITSVNSRTDSKAACFKSIENDVLMPTSDVTPNGLATASCIAESNVNLGGDILIIRPNGAEIDGTFLAYKIRMDHRQIMQLVSGTTVFHIYGRDMAEFTCKAPTTEEQQAIVSVLSDMETEIEALDRRRDKARQIKEGMMQQLLTGRVRLVAPQTTEPAA